MSDDKKRGDYAVVIDDREREKFEASPSRSASMAPPHTSLANNGLLAIIFYCFSSILMTVTNKYVLSGLDYNLNFFLLCVQSVVCVIAIQTAKSMGFISYRDYNSDEAKKWFPISLLLIGMIYTGSKALQFLSIPVYTIFKNLTIILIAYGEVLWFGGSVSKLTLSSFGLMVVSSVIAAWSDIQYALSSHSSSEKASQAVSTLNAGYFWMLVNCLCTASYALGMRKRIKLTNFKDFDTMFYNNLLTIPILLASSLLIEDWSSANLSRNFPIDQRNNIIMAMIFSGLSTVFISYSSAWCVRVTTSTIYSMVGALNKLPIAISGLIFFDAPVTFGSISAIIVGCISGVVFAIAKLKKPASEELPVANPVGSASNQSVKDALKD
ncbi:Golgi GDP-mannose transporter [Trichodelitschia bisporula]|uniref:GDP-mannose transporter n=1 Tax=Trichodelitschia bisporula TaxID=703511 RepID=A0A6G1I9I0_9PEZI|nr:Golgi GDP-mannose transporter [Trichodelitschia bisporula]